MSKSNKEHFAPFMPMCKQVNSLVPVIYGMRIKADTTSCPGNLQVKLYCQMCLLLGSHGISYWEQDVVICCMTSDQRVIIYGNGAILLRVTGSSVIRLLWINGLNNNTQWLPR